MFMEDFMEDFMDNSVNTNATYWTYCGIRIPMSIKCVPSRDNINTRYQDGTSTQCGGFGFTSLSVYEYRVKYGEIRNDGVLHWKTKNKEELQLHPLYKRWLEFYYFGKI